MRRLYILDDAPQFESQSESEWELLPVQSRFDSLARKYNYLAQNMAYRRDTTIVAHNVSYRTYEKWQPDGFVIMEDDDVFLPWHLSQIAKAFAAGVHYFRLPQVYSNYQCAIGGYIKEGAEGRFHSSWAYSAKAFEAVGGYPMTGRLDFDAQMGSIMREFDPNPPIDPTFRPSYVYRWARSAYNGSQAGEEGYQNLWEALGRMPAPWVGKLVPQMDEETRLLYSCLV